jgi:hypothetical protein
VTKHKDTPPPPSPRELVEQAARLLDSGEDTVDVLRAKPPERKKAR